MNKALALCLATVAVAFVLAPTVAAYPWGPVGSPPPNHCGYTRVMVNCFEYSWYCSPSYNESPDICYWEVTGFCTLWVDGCVIR